jgi:hypothetical protein
VKIRAQTSDNASPIYLLNKIAFPFVFRGMFLIVAVSLKGCIAPDSLGGSHIIEGMLINLCYTPPKIRISSLLIIKITYLLKSIPPVVSFAYLHMVWENRDNWSDDFY